MIIDTIQLAGLDAYFQDPGNPGQVDLAKKTSRTKPLAKGKQLEISGIELLVESDNDLTSLFNLNLDTEGYSPTTSDILADEVVVSPLVSITVMKEMFPRLFADPFRHRVHNIGGFEDFKRGTLENGKAMDIDGVPTIVSTGTGTCKWTSPLYPMAEPVTLNHASWELAASTKTPSENFGYSIELHAFDAGQNLIQTVHLTNPADPAQAGQLDPTKPRMIKDFKLAGVASYQVVFTADVKKDAAIHEKHTTLIGESIGTPLLRAVNLLEPVETIYDVNSLQELLSLSSEYHLFEFQGQPLKKMLVTLNLSATLVHSDYEKFKNNDRSKYNDPTSFYEFVEIAVKTDKFSNVEAKLDSEVLTKSNAN